MNRNRFSKYLLIAIGVLFIGSAPFAHAATVATAVGTLIGGITLSAVMLPMMLTAYFFGYIGSWFVTLGGTLINWTITLNGVGLNANNPVIHTGWTVSRDLANLGFVLAIILIAFITITRYESYDSKKMLVRLISAALLVNFSLVIAGVFIDFSGIMTNFFLSKATSGSLETAQQLTGAFKAQNFFQQTSDPTTIQGQVQGLSNDVNKGLVFLTTETFVGAFTALTAISLLTVAIMLYVRYIALTILLILAPMAWLMWIWPDLEKYWHQWWSSFMRWAFFAPGISFFIYLAIQMGQLYSSPTKASVALSVSGADSLASLIQNFGATLGQMIAVLGILYGGIYAANQLGIMGAEFGVSMAGKLKGYVTGAPQVAGGYLGRRYGMGGLDALSTRFTQKTIGQHLQTATNLYAKSGLLGSTAAQRAYSNLAKSNEASVEEWTKHYSEQSPEARLKDA